MASASLTELEKLIPKSNLRQQLHISGVNMLTDCGYRFMFRYMLGIRRPPSAYMHVGTATDDSVHGNLNHKIETEEPLPRPEAIGLAEASIDLLLDREPIELDPDEKREGKSLEIVKGEAKDKTVNLAGLHYDQAAPQIQPWRTRRKFSIDMDKFLRQRAKQLHELGEQSVEKQGAKIL